MEGIIVTNAVFFLLLLWRIINLERAVARLSAANLQAAELETKLLEIAKEHDADLDLLLRTKIFHGKVMPTLIVVLALLAGPASAQELVGPPASPETAADIHRDVVRWADEKRAAETYEARRQANQLCAWSAADLTATELVLASDGGHEHNPLVRNRGLRIGLSAAACGLALYEARGAHPKPSQLRKAKWVRIAAVAINVIVLAR